LHTLLNTPSVVGAGFFSDLSLDHWAHRWLYQRVCHEWPDRDRL